MMLELRCPLWFSTPFGEARAIILLDYGPEDDLLWVCIQQEGEHLGELWTWHNSKVRVLDNPTYLRKRPAPSLSDLAESHPEF